MRSATIASTPTGQGARGVWGFVFPTQAKTLLEPWSLNQSFGADQLKRDPLYHLQTTHLPLAWSLARLCFPPVDTHETQILARRRGIDSKNQPEKGCIQASRIHTVHIQAVQYTMTLSPLPMPVIRVQSMSIVPSTGAAPMLHALLYLLQFYTSGNPKLNYREQK
ncbi:uncharacterized protein LOC119355318 [Triticum dicoccoides]|uniref:uncharacterized protein LOC119355318 n=1 Tax=Triticum dicoccoides TaxID=85692 RepID=UPI0018905E02|nr:uncharacterized protein LOC119355318 [Triticum dicoccoides]